MDSQPSTVTVVEEKFKLEDGSIGSRFYHKGKFLGKGGFAKCYEFISEETKSVFACKLI